MRHHLFSSPWILFMLTILSNSITAFMYRIPRLSPIGRTLIRHPEVMSSAQLSDDFKTFYYNQTLDHFNYKPESYTLFPQRYLINFKYWGGAKSNAPILAYFGAEGPIDDDLYSIGFPTDNNAFHFNALIVYIEHRYYGKSIPFGSRKRALRNASTRGYFNSAQAIADYAAILIHIKKKLNAEKSPVIVIGGSYGGMLASWFRLKYPHIALGALASSAPILYFDAITPQNGYNSIVTKDFREASKTCYQTIRDSWSEIKKVASQPKGLSILSKEFKTCSPLNNYDQLENYLWWMYASAAQYNEPPTYPVTIICRGIDGASANGIVGKIAAGVFASEGDQSCYINKPKKETETEIGWRWQTCSEMVTPMSSENNTMFPVDTFDLQDYIKDCKRLYGVEPRPHWVTSYYGGHDIKLVLQRFGSNIIFSNGLRDPYSSGGVLHNLSDTLLAVHTTNGSHCLDIQQATKTDPEWLVNQRKTEARIIKGWLKKYYADLASSK